MTKEFTPEWVSLSAGSKILGIPYQELKADVLNGRIPSRMRGNRNVINIKLVKAWYARQDIENMNVIKKAIERNPMNRRRIKVPRVAE